MFKQYIQKTNEGCLNNIYKRLKGTEKRILNSLGITE